MRNLLLLLFLALGFFFAYSVRELLLVGAGYNAKILCSNTFMAGRKPEAIIKEDLFGIERLLFSEVDLDTQAAVSWFPGIAQQTALYLGQEGCVLLAGTDAQEMRKRYPLQQKNDNKLNLAKPVSMSLTQENQKSTYQALQQEIHRWIALSNIGGKKQSRAILVKHQGQLVAEHYAEGFHSAMPLLGWSMSKSVLNAVVGILVKQNKIELEQPAAVAQWQQAGDSRNAITLNHLLRMESGLQFEENKRPIFSHLTTMLFLKPDVFAYAVAKSLQHQPGKFWYYSSGNSNIIAGLVRKSLGGDERIVNQFIRQHLFSPLRMHKAVMEMDASGNIIASSFMYATAREWIDFGQLYLQDGIWENQRILPEGWVSYSTAATESAAHGQYGAHFWINAPSKKGRKSRPYPSLPQDMYYAAGFKGQRLIMIPSISIHQYIYKY